MYTKEEIETGIENGDTEILNYVLSGKAEQPPTVVDNGTDTVPVEEVEQEVPIEEPVDHDREQLENELKYFKEKAETVRVEPPKDNGMEELQKQLDAQKKLVEQLTAKKAKESFNIDADGEDDDLVDEYSRKNREYLRKLSENSVDQDTYGAMRTELDELKAKDAERVKVSEEEKATERGKQQKRQLFKEVEDFQNSNKHFDTPIPVSELFGQISSFKERIKDFIRSDSSQEVEKAYYSIVNGKTTADEKLRAEVIKTGIQVPEGADEYVKLAEIVDLKNGVKYNRISGEYEDIVDDYGNKIMQRSLGDAFKLSTYNDRIVEASKQAAREVQIKLENRSNSAVTISNDNTASGEDGRLSADAISSIMNTSNKALLSDPKLTAQYNKAIAQLGLA